MSLLFHHGRQYDLRDSNPIQWVRQSAKRRTAPDVLTAHEIRELLVTLPLRERTLVLLAVTTGLRRSELLALKWKDVDFENKQIQVTRSIVNSVVGSCKTESSQKPVPAHDELLGLCLDGMINRAINRLRVGFSQAPESGQASLSSPGNHAATQLSYCAKAGHQQENRLAHLSPYVFHAASIYRSRTENHAGTTAPLHDPGDARYLHTGGHVGEAYCAGGCGRALVPTENESMIKRRLGQRRNLCLFCAFLCLRKIKRLYVSH
jgi:integrase